MTVTLFQISIPVKIDDHTYVTTTAPKRSASCVLHSSISKKPFIQER
jgi:hypothetical protein